MEWKTPHTALGDLQQTGEIDRGSINRNKINQNLKSEGSFGMNISATYTGYKGNLQSLDNLSSNDLKNMIESMPIIPTKNIYNYHNLLRTFTQGIELRFRKHFLKYLHLSPGYQYLDHQDTNTSIRETKASSKKSKKERSPKPTWKHTSRKKYDWKRLRRSIQTLEIQGQHQNFLRKSIRGTLRNSTNDLYRQIGPWSQRRQPNIIW